MSQHGSPSEPSPDGSGGPWAAFGYLVAGVGVYGALGWLLDWWLGTSFLLPVGVVLGAVLGLYLTYVRINKNN